MKFTKLDNAQAKKVSGKYDSFNALDPRYVEENFFILPLELSDAFMIAKDYINNLSLKVIDMGDKNDTDAITLKLMFSENENQSDARNARRVEKWDYNKIEINKEL